MEAMGHDDDVTVMVMGAGPRTAGAAGWRSGDREPEPTTGRDRMGRPWSVGRGGPGKTWAEVSLYIHVGRG